MRRETQNILLLLLGGALLKIAVTGDYLRYVKASQQPWLLAAGVVMVALAAAAITRDLRAAHRQPATADPQPGAVAGEPGLGAEPVHTLAAKRADGAVRPAATAAGPPVVVAGDPVLPSADPPSRAEDPPSRAEAAIPAQGAKPVHASAGRHGRLRPAAAAPASTTDGLEPAPSVEGAQLQHASPSGHGPGPRPPAATSVKAADDPGSPVEAAVPAAPAHDDHDDHGRGHARSAWLLLLPVLAILLVAPPALGADSVARAGNRAPAPPASADGDNLVDFPPLPRASPFDDTVSDFTARAGWDRAHSLAGRPVRLTGFVAHQGADTYLARLVIACCAADAFPVKVKVTGGGVDSLADDTWLQATVLLVPGSSTEANEWTPAATVAAVRRIAEPGDAYEY